MTFPTITIPDPASVGKWLDEELGTDEGKHAAMFCNYGWTCLHWFSASDYVRGTAPTPGELVAVIRDKVAANDPLEKLRKEWIAAGRPDLNTPAQPPR